MMSSTVGSVARSNDEPLKTASSISAAVNLLKSSQARLLLIDLQTPKLKLSEVGIMLQSFPDGKRPRAVAYAQHVYKELLDEASSVGFDQILTRGQLHSNVVEVLGT